MKSHTLIILTLALALTSCKPSAVTDGQGLPPCDLSLKEGEVNAINPNIRGCRIPVREPGANLSYNIVSSNFTKAQEQKLDDAMERLELVINSTAFKQRVLNHSYNGKKTFIDNLGLSNEQIYNKIMQGAEKLQAVADHEMDLEVVMYYKNNSTVGYTYANVNKIWVNSKFFNSYRPSQVAANITHEWTHKLGFGHASNNTSSRPYSVPYGIGTIIRELVDEM